MVAAETRSRSGETPESRARLAAHFDWCAAELRNPDSLIRKSEILGRLHDAGHAEPDPIQSYADISHRYTSLREVIVDGFLRRGEIANLISSAKVGKTWLLMSLMLSAAAGRDWLGHRISKRYRVLAIDNELHHETFFYRMRTVAEAMGLDESEYADRVYLEIIRGKNMDAGQIRSTFGRKYAKVGIDLITTDSLYKTIAKGGDENSNTGMKDVFETFDAWASEMNAAMVVVHHSTKGDQSGKDVTDVGSGAGAISRAADTHAILRQHIEDNCAVLETRVRSFEPQKPKAIRWAFPLWGVDEQLDPNMLRNSTKSRKAETDSENRAELMEIVRRVINNGGQATITAIQKASKTDADSPIWRRDKVKRVVGDAVKMTLLEEKSDAANTYYIPVVPTEGGF